jgi:hypothetical protein
MMKKFIALSAVLILVSGLCFAQVEDNFYGTPEPPAIEKFDLEITVGFPIHWTNAVHDQDFYWFNPEFMEEDKSVTANTAIGVAMLYNFNKKIGVTLDADFFYGAKLSGFANPTSDYNSLFGANVLIGPVFYLYNGTFLRIPLAVGGHLYYFSDDSWVPNLAGYDPQNPSASPTEGFWMNRRDLQVGPGASLGVQFHFNSSLYIFSRTNVALDIFRWHQMKYIADDGNGGLTDETKTHTDLALSWNVKPTLGLGVKF